MKKFFLIFIIFLFPSISFWFDFSDTKAKKKICEEKNNSNTKFIYNEKENTCTEIRKSDWKEIKNIFDFNQFYCQKDWDYRANRSYVKNNCIFWEDDYIYEEEKPGEISYYDMIRYEYWEQKSYFSKKEQEFIWKFYKYFTEKTKNFSTKNKEILSKKVILKIEKNLPKIKNKRKKDLLRLLKYEIENYYLKEIYWCKWNYCNKWFDFSTYNKKEKIRQKLKLKNNTELILKTIDRLETFWCYWWKTILKKNWKEKIIIDDKIKIDEWRSLCSVIAQVVDDDNVRLFTCISDWAWSWECSVLAFNLNINSEKLSFIWEDYYTPGFPFNPYIYEKRKKQRKKELDDYLKSLKNMEKEELNQEKIWFNNFLKKEKIIKDYFRKEHWITNIVFENEYFKEFFKNN